MTSSSWTPRIARTELEVQGVYALWRTMTVQLGPPNPAAIRDAMHCGELLVVVTGGRIVGFVKFHKRRDGWITIYDVASCPRMRGKGIGRALVDAICQLGPVRLKCPIDNASNVFYRSYGFTCVSAQQGRKRALNVWEHPQKEEG